MTKELKITKLLSETEDIELEIVRLSAGPLLDNVLAKMREWANDNPEPEGDTHLETAFHTDPRNGETLVVASFCFKGNVTIFGFLARCGLPDTEKLEIFATGMGYGILGNDPPETVLDLSPWITK
jgi:hypothetical protein